MSVIRSYSYEEAIREWYDNTSYFDFALAEERENKTREIEVDERE
jgi:hypothetical protein